MNENYFSQFGISRQITNLEILKNKIKSHNAFEQGEATQNKKSY
jgi:hypothetical protein